MLECLLKVFHSIILGRIKTELTRECWLLLVSGSGSGSGFVSVSVCVSLSRPGAVTASAGKKWEWQWEWGRGRAGEGELSAWLAIKCRKNHKIIVNVERISHYTQGAGACFCPRQVPGGREYGRAKVAAGSVGCGEWGGNGGVAVGLLEVVGHA